MLLLLAFMLWAFRVTRFGTEFTFLNYYVQEAAIGISGMMDTTSQASWYSTIADPDNPTVGLGLGPNTRMYYSWAGNEASLRSWAAQERSGQSNRSNELGILILPTAMWGEIGSMGIGFDRHRHRLVRPYIGQALDGAEGEVFDQCDGATCWNELYLRTFFRERFLAVDSFSTGDLTWMVSILLHKIHLNLDLTDGEAQDFRSFMSRFLAMAAFVPEQVASTWLGGLIQGPTRSKREELLERNREAIRRKWPAGPWAEQEAEALAGEPLAVDSGPSTLDLLASAMLDSLALAGGVSVPNSLRFMLALLYVPHAVSGDASSLDLMNEGTLVDFILETLRRFPPVAGVPRWVTEDGGATWRHEVPNVAQAMRDPQTFPSPMEFQPGRPGLNHNSMSSSLLWAEAALVGGDVADPDSRSCPAKRLSLAIFKAFMQEFLDAGPWEAKVPVGPFEAPTSWVHMSSYAPIPDFTLSKVLAREAAAEAAAAPAAGASSSEANYFTDDREGCNQRCEVDYGHAADNQCQVCSSSLPFCYEGFCFPECDRYEDEQNCPLSRCRWVGICTKGTQHFSASRHGHAALSPSEPTAAPGAEPLPPVPSPPPGSPTPAPGLQPYLVSETN